MIKKQFTLYIENKPGVLASLTDKLASQGINIEGISVAGTADVGLMQIVVSNAEKAEKVLNGAGVPFTSQDVAVLPLKNEPGALSSVVTRLSDAGINLNYVYATACACDKECRCYVVISAPDLESVEQHWEKLDD